MPGDEADDEDEQQDPVPFVRGLACDVAMSPKIHAAFLKLPIKPRIALEERMKFLAEVGPQNVPNSEFAPEGRHELGHGKTVFLRAFKDGSVRVYCGQVNISAQRTYICTAIDTAKKQTRADQAILKRAARLFGEYEAKFGGSSDDSEERNKGREEPEAKKKSRRSRR